MSKPKVFVYLARLEDGDMIADLATTPKPVQAGEKVNLRFNGTPTNFNVLKVERKVIGGREIDIMTVRPAH